MKHYVTALSMESPLHPIAINTSLSRIPSFSNVYSLRRSTFIANTKLNPTIAAKSRIPNVQYIIFSSNTVSPIQTLKKHGPHQCSLFWSEIVHLDKEEIVWLTCNATNNLFCFFKCHLRVYFTIIINWIYERCRKMKRSIDFWPSKYINYWLFHWNMSENNSKYARPGSQYSLLSILHFILLLD